MMKADYYRAPPAKLLSSHLNFCLPFYLAQRPPLFISICLAAAKFAVSLRQKMKRGVSVTIATTATGGIVTAVILLTPCPMIDRIEPIIDRELAYP